VNIHFSHVAFLVNSTETASAFLESQDIDCEEPEVFDSEGTKEVYVGSYEEESGLLLLVEAVSDGPYKKALTKRGPSLHHVAIDVLNIEEFLQKAQLAGWQKHAISDQTLKHKTAWLFKKGVPTLIEVHQKKQLSTKPTKVTNLVLPITGEQQALFSGIGLGNVTPGEELSITLDGLNFTFDQLKG